MQHKKITHSSSNLKECNYIHAYKNMGLLYLLSRVARRMSRLLIPPCSEEGHFGFPSGAQILGNVHVEIFWRTCSPLRVQYFFYHLLTKEYKECRLSSLGATSTRGTLSPADRFPMHQSLGNTHGIQLAGADRLVCAIRIHRSNSSQQWCVYIIYSK